MARYRILLVPFVLSALSLQATAAAQETRDSTFDLPGAVLEYGTDRPVPTALVEATEAGVRVLTDSIGRFVIRGLAAGNHTFRAQRLGYIENVEPSSVGPGNVLIIRVMPRPVVLEGLTVIADRLESRRLRVGSRSEVLGREYLATTAAPTIADALRSRYGVVIVPCPHQAGDIRGCVRDRGRVQSVRVWLDEVPLPAGAGLLDLYSSHEIERAEYYAGLHQIRLYTPAFIERLARQGRSLQPICIVCDE